MLSREPISKRAWTFQERILSTRLLHYGTRMLWQCRCSVKSGGGLIEGSLDDSTVDLDTLRRAMRETETPRKLYDIWYQTIKEYTVRNASLDEDKLPAISALAQKFGELMHDEYLAGIWRGDILRGLLWSTYPTLDLLPPKQWTAPSWSWACNKNVISYNSLPMGEAMQVAKVTNCQVTPRSTLNPFAALSSGELEIRGKVLSPGKEMLELFVMVENRLPWPMLGDYYWGEKNTVGAGCKDWEAPDDCVLLVLFITREEHWKSRDADSRADAWYDAFFQEHIPSIGVAGTAPVVFVVNNGEPLGIFGMNDVIEIAGLLLAPAGDGKFQRVACMTRAKLRLFHLLDQWKEETVVIV